MVYVRIAQKLEEQGLLGDPFLHTKEDVKVWQMIVYHRQNCGFTQQCVSNNLFN